MSKSPLSLADAIAADFGNCDRDALEAFANMMEIEFSSKIGDERLRGRMLKRIGKTLNAGEAIEVSDPGARPFEVVPPEEYSNEELNNLIQLNLTPNGIWEGRRRLVTIFKPENMKGVQPHPFTWARSQTLVPWNTTKPVSVPYPVYNILLNTKQIRIEQERTTDRMGEAKIINHRIKEDRFSWSDAGDDPKTIHLPRSQKEQFRAVARAANYFEGWGRQQLARLCRRLNLRYARGTEVEEIREMVLIALGVDMDMLDGASGVLRIGEEVPA